MGAGIIGRPTAVLVVLALWCVLGLCHPASAQQPASNQQPAPAQQGDTRVAPSQPATPSEPTQTETSPSSPKDDRIFWSLPNLLTVENGTKPAPLTTRQKFQVVAQGTFDPVEFAYIGLITSINQASNSNPTFGQGLIGYSKRYALEFTDVAIGNFMTGAVYPTLLHQDPRYYQMGKGKFVHRFFYAGTRVFVTHGDSGKTQFNFSEILGNATGAAISNAYHPGPRTLVSNVDVWWSQIGWDAVSYELKEFWPDIHKAFHRQK
jgi:hypothetical protein